MGEGREYRRRQAPGLVGPVILITAGVLILLHNQGVVHINFWELWRFWPVLLILAGLEALIGRRSVLGNLIVLILTLAVVAGLVVMIVAAPGTLGSVSYKNVDRISEPLEGIEQADLTVQFAAGQLQMGRLEDSASLVEGKLSLVNESKPVWTAERSAGRASMRLGYEEGQTYTGLGRGDEWDLRLSPQAGFSLDVNVGAGGATLDLTGLDVRGLQVQAGAAQTTVVLPASGEFAVSVRGGVGALVLEIPEGMAARLRIDRGLSAVSVSPRFKQEGQEYVTADWEINENRVDVDLQVGVGLVTVKEP